MVKVLTKKAAKDYPDRGIKKGDTYYEWTFFRQKAIKSKTPPTRVQLTQNDATQAVYSAYDDAVPATADDVEGMAASLREASEMEDEKFNNLPEGFQQGDAGQRLEERRDAFSEAADALDEIASTLREEEEMMLPEKPEWLKDDAEDDPTEEQQAQLDELLAPFQEATYYEFDEEAWTWTLNSDALQEAVGGTEPDA